MKPETHAQQTLISQLIFFSHFFIISRLLHVKIRADTSYMRAFHVMKISVARCRHLNFHRKIYDHFSVFEF